METIDKLKLNTKGPLCLLGYGGSIAYGTNVPESDTDLRGIYINPINEVLGIKKDSEEYVDNVNDITVYSLKKALNLLSQCNPNTIEILGLKPEHYLFKDEFGDLVLQNKSIFLSKKAIHTFGNYAKSQLNRLINKSGRAADKVVSNEVRSLQKVSYELKKRIGVKNLFVEEVDNRPVISINEKLDIEDLMRIFSDFSVVHSDYKNSKRNNKAIEHNKLSKHMMHLIRLYMMGEDILSSGEIITYREKEHDLLMSIRNGDYLESDGATPTVEFEKLLDEYKNRFDKAAETTLLPDFPDYDGINELQKRIFRSLYL